MSTKQRFLEPWGEPAEVRSSVNAKLLRIRGLTFAGARLYVILFHHPVLFMNAWIRFAQIPQLELVMTLIGSTIGSSFWRP